MGGLIDAIGGLATVVIAIVGLSGECADDGVNRHDRL
jgi:hypothetical protein